MFLVHINMRFLALDHLSKLLLTSMNSLFVGNMNGAEIRLRSLQSLYLYEHKQHCIENMNLLYFSFYNF